MLQQLNLFFWRNLLLQVLTVLLHLLRHLASHLLKFDSNLSSLLLYQLLQLFVVIGLLAEMYCLTGVSLDFVEFEAKRDVYSNGSEVVDYDLFYVDVLKGIGVANELCLVVNALLVALEGSSSSSV